MSVVGAILQDVSYLGFDEIDEDIPKGLPMTPAQVAARRIQAAREFGAMPFDEETALITRSLWVVYHGEWGTWTHAVIPIDKRTDMGQPGVLEKWCDVGFLMRPSRCHPDEQVLIILRRPRPVGISAADLYAYELVHESAVRHETAPWSFFVAGPEGTWELVNPGSASLAAWR